MEREEREREKERRKKGATNRQTDRETEVERVEPSEIKAYCLRDRLHKRV